MPRILLAALASGLLGMGVLALGVPLEEGAGLRLLFSLRGPRPVPPDVLVVTLDKPSADRLGLPPTPSRWPRSLHAQLVDRLAERGAKAIVFDVYFGEAKTPADDRRFADAVARAGNVVLCARLEREILPVEGEEGALRGEVNVERLHWPFAELAQGAAGVAPWPVPKAAVQVREFWAFKTGAGGVPTLPVVALQVFGAETEPLLRRALANVGERNTEPRGTSGAGALAGAGERAQVLREAVAALSLVAGRRFESLARGPPAGTGTAENRLLGPLLHLYQGPDSRYLDFYGPPRTVPTVPLHHVLAPPPGSPPLDVAGKAVFIGLSEGSWPRQADGFPSVFSRGSGLDLSGVEIAATAFANLLEDRTLRPLGVPAQLGTIFLWGAALAALCLAVPPAWSGPTVLGLGAAYFLLARYRFDDAGQWLPVVVPLFLVAPAAFFGALVWNYADARRDRRAIREAIRYYLPEPVVDQLSRRLAGHLPRSRMVYATCLMTDAERYTRASEAMEPTALASHINRYFEAIFAPVRQNGGIVSNVVGDAVLALWVADRRDAGARGRACRAALEVARVVDWFNAPPNPFPLPTRVGLHAGYVSMSAVGAFDHFEYRPVGDIVNAASRIENLNKHLGTRRLASAEAAVGVEGVLTRPLGRFVMTGKTRAIAVSELLARTEDAEERQYDLCARFAEALQVFGKGDWEEALCRFDACAVAHGEDGPSRFYGRLCREYLDAPPPEPWDGVVHVARE